MPHHPRSFTAFVVASIASQQLHEEVAIGVLSGSLPISCCIGFVGPGLCSRGWYLQRSVRCIVGSSWSMREKQHKRVQVIKEFHTPSGPGGMLQRMRPPNLCYDGGPMSKTLIRSFPTRSGWLWLLCWLLLVAWLWLLTIMSTVAEQPIHHHLHHINQAVTMDSRNDPKLLYSLPSLCARAFI